MLTVWVEFQTFEKSKRAVGRVEFAGFERRRIDRIEAADGRWKVGIYVEERDVPSARAVISDTRNWNNYNGRVKDWISQLLAVPGAVSFMAYRAADGASPDTTTLLEFRTVDEARKAKNSEQMTVVLQGLRAVGVAPKILVVERSPFTPEPIRA
jgi:hypothetical protein